MGILDIFKRGESADEALLAVAARDGWVAQACSGVSMLPPSHAAAGLHGLESRNPPACGGRAYAVPLGASALQATLSHLKIFQSDDEEHVYDMVSWRRTGGRVPRFEVELGAGAWGHHRLVDRFQPSGYSTHSLAGGVVLRLARDTDAACARAWCAAPGWSDLKAMAHGPDGLRGCAAEGLDDRIAVFTWAGMARKGQQRWRDLVRVAEGLDALLNSAG